MSCRRVSLSSVLNIDAIKRKLDERDQRLLVWFLYARLTRRPRRRRRIEMTNELRVRLTGGDWAHAGGDATCSHCGLTWHDHDVLDTPNGGWWAVACDGRLLKL